MPQGGNFTLRTLAKNLDAEKTAHQLLALQRSGKYSELRILPHGRSKTTFQIAGYRWPSRTQRRRLGIGKKTNPMHRQQTRQQINPLKVKTLAETILELQRVQIELGGWIERPDVPPDVARFMIQRLDAVTETLNKLKRQNTCSPNAGHSRPEITPAMIEARAKQLHAEDVRALSGIARIRQANLDRLWNETNLKDKYRAKARQQLQAKQNHGAYERFDLLEIIDPDTGRPAIGMVHEIQHRAGVDYYLVAYPDLAKREGMKLAWATEAEIRRRVNPANTDLPAVCAWCHREYDPAGKPHRLLTPAEYAKIESHGICRPCAEREKAEFLKRKAISKNPRPAIDKDTGQQRRAYHKPQRPFYSTGPSDWRMKVHDHQPHVVDTQGRIWIAGPAFKNFWQAYRYILEQLPKDPADWLKQNAGNPALAKATGNQVWFGQGGQTRMGWIHRATPTRYEITYKEGQRTRTVWRRKDQVQFLKRDSYGRIGGYHKNHGHPQVKTQRATSKRATVRALRSRTTASGKNKYTDEDIAFFASTFGPRNNPADDPVRRAARMSELFNGRPPRRVRSVRIELPKALMHIGPCAQIDYVSRKFDGKKRQYYHIFEGEAELYAAADPMPDGRTLLMILGDFKIKPEGITG